MPVTSGYMNPDMLGQYIKGWAKRSMELINTDTQNYDLLGNAFNPLKPVDTEKIEFYSIHGVPGRMDVDLDTAVDSSRWSITRVSKDLKWDKFDYLITDAAKTRAAIDTLAMDGTRMALNYFGAVRTYRAVSELVAKAGDSDPASAAWNTAGANVEGDIVNAIESIVSATGIDPANYTFGVLYPSSRMRGIDQLDLINNVQQSLKEYLMKIWKINFYAFTPYKDADGNAYIDIHNKTSSDALGTNAIVFVEGDNTMRGAIYQPTDIPLTETMILFKYIFG
ncbi:MAG: hypothetical protein BPH43C_01 [Phage 5P_1]|nr:MAG: hypothetical protein BPH43C_01 [Phage 5P_1]